MYIKKILWAIAIIGLIIFGLVAYYIYSAMFQPNTKFSTEAEYIYVPTDATYSQVRNQLLPLLDDINTFDALARQKKYTSYIKAGRFAISEGMNNNEIINSIRSKNLPFKIAFNNQNSLQDLAGRISKQIEVDSLELYKAMTDDDFLNENGFSKATSLGMYLPNSYEFFWNTSAKDFRGKMLKEYNRFWTEARKEQAKKLNLSQNDIMTLASIVYEESKQADEQPRVAGVYLNRLRIGMPLQADPTLKFAAYQLPQYKNTVIRRVLNIHKDIKSPYNTYKNAGLPPGLIAMPDISAIKAVLSPEKHSYLYFAADSKRIGYHKFAKSLAQHNNNAREYQRYLSSQGINK
ncbi:endolytic transglycosylase MltG [Winogradskyella sp. UBA3174]|uniref:endolytic transglycosylase MltG n=1 Tax=Winogradskyella sp. UBA3174 TaxID=1947785 RepID=UPI0025E97F5F|nr:endolytic transglycosylase MltG [Winogradskyella sp. UBA3174]|tara:strand:+ start:13346 stop:14389 length:1044 start_codon:yes stop_codon:yes gene_type:complete